MVVDSRAKMNNVLMRISDLVVNKCRSSMLIHNIDISRLMIHAKQIEEQKLKHVCRELKKVRTKERNSSNNRYDIQDKPRFKSGFLKKDILVILGSIRVRCLLRIPNRKNVVGVMLIDLFVLNVLKGMMASVLWARVISIIVERVAT